MSGEPTPAACHREIVQLHDLFVDWYTETVECDFERMETVIASDFEMVTPDGDRVGRNAVLEMVRESRDEYAPGAFDITIRNVEPVDVGDDHALVRYEECQQTPDGENVRLSTVLFRPAVGTPEGVEWVSVHETWLESEG